MNKVILMGRLTRDPEIRYTSGENQTAVARYTLAVDRRFKRQGDEQTADFISIVAFGKAGEFVEKYFRQGQRVLVSGRIQTGSYTKKEGQRVYTTNVVADEQEFADAKRNGGAGGQRDVVRENNNVFDNGFMNIPDGVEDENLPFN